MTHNGHSQRGFFTRHSTSTSHIPAVTESQPSKKSTNLCILPSHERKEKGGKKLSKLKQHLKKGQTKRASIPTRAPPSPRVMFSTLLPLLAIFGARARVRLSIGGGRLGVMTGGCKLAGSFSELGLGESVGTTQGRSIRGCTGRRRA